MKLSFKRQSEYKEFQSFVDAKPHKLLQVCQTRWLALHCCVKRVLEQYKALKLYFRGEHLLDNNKASNIYSVLSNPFTEMYLHFLDFVLPILTSVNLAFQSESPQIHLIYSKVATAYKTILDCYIDNTYLNSTPLSKDQYRNPEHYLRPGNIYLGGTCTAILSNNLFSKTDIDEFETNCLHFYVECCHQLYKRFPLNSEHMKCLEMMSFLDPKNAKNIRSISSIAYHFEKKLNLNLNDVDIEWRQLRNQNNLNFELGTFDFWKHIKTLKNCGGDEVYPLINKLVAYIFTLPHSSACVERLFSTINLNKTKVRNQLSTKTLTGILNSKSCLINNEKFCYNFDVPDKMISKHNAEIYKNLE